MQLQEDMMKVLNELYSVRQNHFWHFLNMCIQEVVFSCRLMKRNEMLFSAKGKKNVGGEPDT